MTEPVTKTLRQDLIDTLTAVLRQYKTEFPTVYTLHQSEVIADALVEWLCKWAEGFEGPNLAPCDAVRVVADMLESSNE